MRGIVTVVAALLLLVVMTPLSVAADGIIFISSAEELSQIGSTLPSDGHYVLSNDISVANDVPSIFAHFLFEDDTVRVVVTSDGYEPTSQVQRLEVTLNGHRGVVNSGLPIVTMPMDALQGMNALHVVLDGTHGTFVDTGGSIVDDATVRIVPPNTVTIPTFHGILDGMGHSISGINVQGPTAALFGSSVGATFRNITIEGTFSSFLFESSVEGNHGNVTSDSSCVSASLVAVAEDTTFERITVRADVTSFLCSEYVVEQGDVQQTDRLGAVCDRVSASGSIVGNSKGCRYIVCSTAGTVSSFIGSSLTFKAVVRPTEISTDDDVHHNLSYNISGGIAGTSDGDRIAHCESGSRTFAASYDRALMELDPGDGFDDDVRCTVVQHNGGIAGHMVGTELYGCSSTSEGYNVSCTNISMRGTWERDDLRGSLAGRSQGCSVRVCLTSADGTSGASESDIMEDTSPRTVLPTCGFSVRMVSDGTFGVMGSTEEGTIEMDPREPVLRIVYDGMPPDLRFVDGDGTVLDDIIYLEPRYDWDSERYIDMSVEMDTAEENALPLQLLFSAAILGTVAFGYVTLRTIRGS